MTDTKILCPVYPFFDCKVSCPRFSFRSITTSIPPPRFDDAGRRRHAHRRQVRHCCGCRRWRHRASAGSSCGPCSLRAPLQQKVLHPALAQPSSLRFCTSTFYFHDDPLMFFAECLNLRHVCSGMTPLTLASSNGHVDVCRLLITCRVDVNANLNGCDAWWTRATSVLFSSLSC